MKTLHLQLTLKSDATFGRGDGVAGLVDIEVEHDRYGLPFLRGRTLKGLLVEECANVFHALKLQGKVANNVDWHLTAKSLFGRPGSGLEDDGEMLVGDARLPADFSAAVAYAVEQEEERNGDNEESTWTPLAILESLTAIRRQTAITVKGAPRKGSLRSMRVVLREMVFESQLTFSVDPNERQKALLASCVASLRRVGTGRNRGRGRVEASLFQEGKDITDSALETFAKEVG